MSQLPIEDKAKLEIEFIDKSKEVDKFDYDVRIKLMIALYTATIALIIVGADKNIIIIIGAVISLILITIIFYILGFKPIVIEFKKKRKMERKRYRILGINPADLNEELKETSLP